MVDRVEDMQLPNAVVQRIIKEALPEGIHFAKDARTTISKAASIFVLYLTTTARHQLKLRNQKTMSPADVLHALEIMEMENFIEPLKKSLEQHKSRLKQKRDKPPTESHSPGITEEADEPQQEEENEVPMEEQHTEDQ